MKVGLALTGTAYIPEAYAYQEYLNTCGVDVSLATEQELDNDCDLIINFMGFKPVWTRSRGSREIHEYHSLSIPPFAITKDFFKSRLNRTPVGRIFLNDFIRTSLGFGDEVPFIMRDMGVHRNFFRKSDASKSFDVIYSGAIESRPGLLTVINRLAEQGLKVLVVGSISLGSYKKIVKNGLIECTGALKYSELPSAYASARIGLNYVRNIYPYSYQTSTKILEYCAAGLGVMTSVTDWTRSFELTSAARFLQIDHVTGRDSVDTFDFVIPDVSSYEWDCLLRRSGFLGFLNQMCD